MSKQIPAEEAMAMNRKERRILGKINGVKIPGTNKPHINPVRQEKKHGVKYSWQEKK